ncbi:MAG: aminopeptidase N [Magnetococcales bacterium]|nr:aminopeptidase N [Magnetococcales bacterium]
MDAQRKDNQTKYLKDYTPPDFLVDTVALTFELDPKATLVHARLALRRNPDKTFVAAPPLQLDGQGLELLHIALDGALLSAKRYRVEEDRLIIPEVPEACILEMQTRIHPAANTALEGLYVSGSLLCTQCEAEGFRKILYYPDRPDVMARFTTTLIADRKLFPTLLSNGNRTDSGELAEGKHFVTWVDPHRKPCYLFALVAGKLACHRDLFTTRSGRLVSLEIYVETPAALLSLASPDLESGGQSAHAMDALKKAMAWDEERFGREYDLDTYMIVAVNDFNMGAMENKGLNIFNAKYVLADRDSATDQDFQQIENIIAHEYFHNWTGNRITCRDWFQLSLKEGLTVFRDQLFSEESRSPAVQRVQDARLIWTQQFAEDAGPTAHPVQPDAYLEINNFYTVTVYDKGAEVVRMIHTLLGAALFRRGMDLYFARHDGQAVTVEEFVRAMEDASGRDLRQFRRWYHQAGTPVVSVTTHHDAMAQTLRLHITQTCPPTPGQPDKFPLHIPLTVGLLGRSGQSLPLRLAGESESAIRGQESAPPTARVLEIRQAVEEVVFTGVAQKPIPSLLRHFSAPVILQTDLTDEELAFLWAHDPDPFNRWSAGQRLTTDLLLRLAVDCQANRPLLLADFFVESFAQVLRTRDLDPATTAMILTLPSATALLEQMAEADPGALHTARLFVRQTLATRLHEVLLQTYDHYSDPEAAVFGRYHPMLAGRRAFKNLCLDYLVSLQWAEFWQLAVRQFYKADNMTDRLAALTDLLYSASPDAEAALAAFAEQWQKNSLVMDKWFAMQARIPDEKSLRRVRQLQKHPLFSLKNPNRVRALLGSFCHDNPLAFHQPSGKGYQWLAKQVLTLDPLNPQVAARLVAAFRGWRKLEPIRRTKMQTALQQIEQTANLSRDVFEIVSKSLKH